AGGHDHSHPRRPVYPRDPRRGCGIVRGRGVDERPPVLDGRPDLPAARAEPRRRGARHALPPPEPRVPAIGGLLPPPHPRHVTPPAVPRGGRAGAGTHAADGPGRGSRRTRGVEPQGAHGRDPEGPRPPERSPVRRVLPRLTAGGPYLGGSSQSNLGRLRSASAIFRPQASLSLA